MNTNNPYDANKGGKSAIVRREIISEPKKGQPYAATAMKQLSIIAILISFSATLPAQTDTIPDTIALSAQHQRILPELIRQQSELEKAIRDVNEKLMILLAAYVDDPRKLQNGAVQFSQDMKKIIVK